MPTIYIQDKLRIEMRPRESGHNTPHVHAIHNGKDVSIDFSGKVIVGGIAKREQDIACAWVIKNRDILMRKWEELH